MNSSINEYIFSKLRAFLSPEKIDFRDLFLNCAMFDYIRQNGCAVFDYDFLMNLHKKDYPKFLKLAYYAKMQERLNLKNPKTINEKIQWLKLYDNTIKLKSILTDKVLVRDFIKDKIGEEYLKPVLWVGKKFDKIPFETLPETFVIKTNHGCKWHSIIKSKKFLLDNPSIYNMTRNKIEGWMDQSFFGWSDFEVQYKDIKPQIFVEAFIAHQNEPNTEFEIWCFNGVPRIFQMLRKAERTNRKVSSFNENFEHINIKFMPTDILIQEDANEHLKKAVELSKILAKDFKLVRVDWVLFENKLYFNEMTFTPYSGFIHFKYGLKFWEKELGSKLNLKE